MPKVDLATAPRSTGSDYPAPLHEEFAERVRIRLGDAAGLTGMGVNLTTLPPGARSSLRHWHENEDEMVFVLSGSLTLIDDDGETLIGPGEAVGFPGGVANAHQFVNRGTETATLLEMGTRPREDRCHYADHDLVAHDHDGTSWYARRDGTRLTDAVTRVQDSQVPK